MPIITLKETVFRLGFKTDPGFSRKWIVSGYGAYGFKDQKFKYGGGMDYIFSRKPWTMAGISYSKDLERLGLSAETIGTNTLFGAFSRFGTFQTGLIGRKIFQRISEEKL